MQQLNTDALDTCLQPTQFGFRKKKGTADAIQLVRRAIGKGESTSTKTKPLLDLLDWEKAFDKVIHEELFRALDRMNVPEKMINALKELCKHPSFQI